MKNIFLALSLILGFSSTLAGTITCSGKIAELSYHSPNKMRIRLDSMNVGVFFCSPDSVFTVSGTTYTTGPETCKTLYSTFLSAQMAQKTIHGMYFDGDSVPNTCNGWASWQAANIRYFYIN